MALRVLTDDERQSLQGSSNFLEKCQWAARNYAAYWAVHDGAGLSTESLRIKWAKDRLQSVFILLSDLNDPSIALHFTKLSKGMQFDLGAAPVDPSLITAAFVSGNKFDELASLYFDLKGEDINFTAGGN